MGYHIYVYENRTNGKIYIGQTSDLKKRDYQHSNKNDNSLLARAIKKYGRGSFDLWTICIVDTTAQANQEEIYWISEMRCQLGKNMVYNITDGGESGRRGMKFSEESL